GRPCRFAPIACAASSTIGTSAPTAEEAARWISSIGAHWPNRCTGMMAATRGEAAARATSPASRLNVAASLSAKIGRAPSRAIDEAVAKNENDDVTTASPGLTPSACSASMRASVPEATPTAWRAPQRAAISRSSCSTTGPRMNRWLSSTSRTAASISARIASCCLVRSKKGTLTSRLRPADPVADHDGREHDEQQGDRRGLQTEVDPRVQEHRQQPDGDPVLDVQVVGQPAREPRQPEEIAPREDDQTPREDGRP